VKPEDLDADSTEKEVAEASYYASRISREVEQSVVNFVFYVYDDDEDDPRYSFWLERDERGRSLYERPPDGRGMWLDPDIGGDYEPVEPTEDLKQVIAGMLNAGIDGGEIIDLPAHERHFVQVLHGTNSDKPGAIPAPVWGWMKRCESEVSGL
jgi:hypothetical protein